MKPTALRKLDYIYLLPAILCFTAFLAGVIPCMWCLDAQVFAHISVAIFVISLLAHALILLRWKRYRDSSPFAYAVTQPVAHLIIMTFALCVGSVNVCQTVAKPGDPPLSEPSELFEHDVKISEVISQFAPAAQQSSPSE